MRIPPSAIAMSALVAIPFGLAIRDGVLGEDRAERDAYDDYAPQARLLGDGDPARTAFELEAQRQADRAREADYEVELAADDARRAREREQAAKELVGDAFVTPGSAYAGLGAALGKQPPAALFEERWIRNGDGPLLGFELPFDADDAGCSTLATVAARTWGEPAHDRVWLDLATHHRAAITFECDLAFGTFTDAAGWIAAIPFGAIGAPRSALPRAAAVDDMWFAPGLDGDRLTTITRVYATQNPDKTLGLTVETTATRDAWRRVGDALAKRLHAKPTQDAADSTVLRWSAPLPVELSLDGDELTLEIGAPAR